MSYRFLVDTYQTERLKTLTVWSECRDADLAFRPSPLARSVREQMVHQCLSESAWFTKMLGIPTVGAELPEIETKPSLIEHYAAASERRLAALGDKPDPWFAESTTFFEVPRPRAWVLVRRVAHTAHHRGQLTIYLRLLGQPLYSTYGPTADTGGLPANGAGVVYRYPDVVALLEAERRGGDRPPLPGPGGLPLTERPDG